MPDYTLEDDLVLVVMIATAQTSRGAGAVTSFIHENVILDETGDPISDETGDYILDET